MYFGGAERQVCFVDLDYRFSVRRLHVVFEQYISEAWKQHHAATRASGGSNTFAVGNDLAGRGDNGEREVVRRDPQNVSEFYESPSCERLRREVFGRILVTTCSSGEEFMALLTRAASACGCVPFF